MKTKKLPGPSFFEMIKESVDDAPYIYLDYPLKLTEQYGEIIRLSGKELLITGALGFEQVFKNNPKNYSKDNAFYIQMRNLFGESLLTTESEAWKQRRKISSPAFHPSKMSAYAPVITEFTAELLESIKKQLPHKIDIFAMFNRLTLNIALKIFCNEQLPENELDKISKAILFGNWYIVRTWFTPRWKLTPNNLRFHYYVDRMHETLLAMIRKRRQHLMADSVSNTTENLLNLLILAKNKETGLPLNDIEILDELKTLLMTGHETTACGLTWMFYLLAEHPGYLWLLEDELARVLGGRYPTLADLPALPLLTAILYESMRLYPPIWSVIRTCLEEDQIGDYTIKPGTLLKLNIYALHRNKQYWEKPAKFYPPRFFNDQSHRHPYAFSPFIAGPRTCIAGNLAITESLLVAATLVQQLRLEKCKATKPRLEPCISLRPQGGLILKPFLR
jgi:cytochrome P450